MSEVNMGGIEANNGEKKAYEPIPNGEYVTVLDRISIKTAKSGNRYVAASFKVASGDHSGRLVFTNFPLFSTSERARKVALDRLNKLVAACGRGDMSRLGLEVEDQAENLSALVGKELIAKVVIRPPSNGYSAKNDISSFATE